MEIGLPLVTLGMHWNLSPLQTILEKLSVHGDREHLNRPMSYLKRWLRVSRIVDPKWLEYARASAAEEE